MSKISKIETVVKVINLLTFLVATLVFYMLCCDFYTHREYDNLGGVIYFMIVLAVNGSIIWNTGRWLISKTDQIEVYGLLAFWIFLIFLYFLFFINALGRWAGAGPGSGG